MVGAWGGRALCSQSMQGSPCLEGQGGPAPSGWAGRGLLHQVSHSPYSLFLPQQGAGAARHQEQASTAGELVTGRRAAPGPAAGAGRGEMSKANQGSASFSAPAPGRQKGNLPRRLQETQGASKTGRHLALAHLVQGTWGKKLSLAGRCVPSASPLRQNPRCPRGREAGGKEGPCRLLALGSCPTGQGPAALPVPGSVQVAWRLLWGGACAQVLTGR